MSLKLLYCFLAFSLTVFGGIYVALSDKISEFQSNFLVASYFIVVIFVFFMLLISFPKLPRGIPSLLNIIFFPFIFSLIQFFYYHLSLYDYLVNIAIIFLAGITLAFAIIVVFGPAFTKKKETAREIFFYLPISLAQIIFIIPGLGAIYIFCGYLIQQYSPWILFIIIITIFEQSYSLCQGLRKSALLDS